MTNHYPKLVAFAGGMASGKDTYGQMWTDELEAHGKSVVHYSFATPLKDEINMILSLMKDKTSIYLIRAFLECTYEEALEIYNILKQEVQQDRNVTANSRTTGIRKALQYWGTDVRRAKDKDYWVRKAKRFIEQAFQLNQSVVITDARFENEFKVVRDLGGTLVRLDCSLDERLRRIKQRDGLEVHSKEINHISEQDYLTYQAFDCIIDTEKYTQEEVFKKLREELTKENGFI